MLDVSRIEKVSCFEVRMGPYPRHARKSPPTPSNPRFCPMRAVFGRACVRARTAPRACFHGGFASVSTVFRPSFLPVLPGLFCLFGCGSPGIVQRGRDAAIRLQLPTGNGTSTDRLARVRCGYLRCFARGQKNSTDRPARVRCGCACVFGLAMPARFVRAIRQGQCLCDRAACLRGGSCGGSRLDAIRPHAQKSSGKTGYIGTS